MLKKNFFKNKPIQLEKEMWQYEATPSTLQSTHFTNFERFAHLNTIFEMMLNNLTDS